MGTIVCVSGTDTGVGKTLVSAGLAAALEHREWTVGVVKPVETGCERLSNGTLRAADAEYLRASLVTRQPLEQTIFHRFSEPVAPAVAARLENRSIDIDAMCDALHARAREVDVLVVEGAGGLLVPFSGTVTFADIVGRLNASLILVVQSKLGAINHAALSCEVARGRSLQLLGYVLNEFLPATAEHYAVAEETNRTELLRVLAQYGAAELGVLPAFDDAVEAGRLPFGHFDGAADAVMPRGLRVA